MYVLPWICESNETPRKKRGQLQLASILEGVMSMLTTIGNGLTIIGFMVSLLSLGVLIFTQVINSVLPRLLGVKN